MNKGGPKKAAYDKAYNARPDQVKKRARLCSGEQLERAVAEERERCARLCDDEFPRLQSSAERDLCAWLAQRIRKA